MRCRPKSIVGAYVLAGEFAAARWQRGASPGQFLAPSTATRLWLRNALFRSAPVRRLLVAGTGSLAANLDLPDYATPTSSYGAR
jgi:hypothetical protein